MNTDTKEILHFAGRQNSSQGQAGYKGRKMGMLHCPPIPVIGWGKKQQWLH
jgi:hypothetical protein